jgi:hypothetical protein
MEKHKLNDSLNSFLQEADIISDIDSNLRRDIDKKYYNSKVNSNYVFPRTKKLKDKLKPASKKFLIEYKNKQLTRNSSCAKGEKIKKLPDLKLEKQISYSFIIPINRNHKRTVSDLSALSIKYKNSPYLKSTSILPKLKPIK